MLEAISMNYDAIVQKELHEWQKEIFKQSNWFNRLSKKTLNKINSKISDIAHRLISESVKQMVNSTLFESNLTTMQYYSPSLTLYERDQLLQEKLSVYRNSATADGAGTGAGGS